MIRKNILPIVGFMLLVITCQSCSGLFSAKVSKNPTDSRIIKSDIENFYKALELAVKDSANAEQIFKEVYFKPGSKGLNDFYRTKIGSMQQFSHFVLGFSEYYQSIQSDITEVGDLENRIYNNFEKFESLYPEARFPDVYLVVGSYGSNGTISRNGILIGAEILARTSESDTSGWNKDILRISMSRNHIPVTVSHELVHFNQDHMKKGNTLLWKSIREGSAEFISELISGATDANFEKFKGIEKEVWRDFQEDRDKAIWNSWQQESESRPRNAGYWAGYLICKAYLEQVRDEKKAVNDILNIADYEKFYTASKVEQYIEDKF